MFEDSGYEVIALRDVGHAAETFVVQAIGADARALITVAHRPEKGLTAERLARAVTRLSAASVPCMVPSRGAGQLPTGEPYVISEIAEGESLLTHLAATGPLTADQLVLLALPVCSALEALRAQGFVVRNIHPEQVVVDGGLTQLNPRLLAPFLFADELDPAHAARSRADVRAVGLLLRAALDDLRASRGEAMKATVSVDAGDVPLREVIDRCLSENPEVCYASPAEVGQALAERQPSTLVARSNAGTGTDAPQRSSDALAELEREGDVLGNYVLEQLIGEGAMGRVFLARHLKLGRQAAVKVLRPEHGLSPQLVQRFFQEAKAVNQINHEHIVEIYDFAEEELPQGGHRAYCVCELLSGQSLAERMSSSPLTIARVVGIVRQVCAALSAAHQVGVIHRDIKPDNLFLIPRGGEIDFVKVLDFGVAKLETPLGERPASGTMEGTIVGTPTYMAPEQAAGQTTDARTDLYSVGTVLYELLSGHTPFSGATFGQLAAQLITSEAPPLPRTTASGERIPPALRALVMRCLEKKPEDRVRSMEALREALAPFEQPVTLHRGRAQAAAALAATGLMLALGFAHRPRPLAPPTAVIPPVQLALADGHLNAGVLVADEGAFVQLLIDSAPSGARVKRADTGVDLGITPLRVNVPRADEVLALRLTVAGRTLERRVRTREDAVVKVDFTIQARKLPAVEPAPAPALQKPGVDPFAL